MESSLNRPGWCFVRSRELKEWSWPVFRSGSGVTPLLRKPGPEIVLLEPGEEECLVKSKMCQKYVFLRWFHNGAARIFFLPPYAATGNRTHIRQFLSTSLKDLNSVRSTDWATKRGTSHYWLGISCIKTSLDFFHFTVLILPPSFKAFPDCSNKKT